MQRQKKKKLIAMTTKSKADTNEAEIKDQADK
jgi:hypothetical protein